MFFTTKFPISTNEFYGRVFSSSEYGKLKPVVSIFIGMDVPTKKQENSFTYFHLTK